MPRDLFSEWEFDAAGCEWYRNQFRKLVFECMDAQTIKPETATSGDDSSLRGTLRHRLEYAPVWLLLHTLALLPRPVARFAGMSLGCTVWLLFGRLRPEAMRNQQMAFPEKSKPDHSKVVRRLFLHLGRQLAEFCTFPQ